jgi:Fe-S oxidoreductase
VKLAVVVQRYGQAINGGAELHARYVAEHLARHAEVEVLTTCATDYVRWKNELPRGEERINGVAVRRFRVKHEREPELFRHRSERVFDEQH